jgi:DNA polymerase-3 subunit epsilon
VVVAALMEALDGGVVVCDGDGTVVGHDDAATRLLGGEEGSDWAGTSVFEFVDEPVFASLRAGEEGEDPERRSGDGAPPSVLASTRGELLRWTARGKQAGLVVLQVQRQPVEEGHGAVSHRLLRDLIESMRAPLASVRAAIETMTHYPAMDAAAAEQFHRIIEEQAVALSETLEAAVAAYARFYREARPLETVGVPALARTLAPALEEETGVSVSVQAPEFPRESQPGAADSSGDGGGEAGGLWVQVDVAAIRRVVVFLGRRVANAVRPEALRLGVRRVRSVAALDLEWEGAPVTTDRLNTWTSETLSWGDTIVEMSAADVLDHHDAQIWVQSDADTARLRLLLPLA